MKVHLLERTQNLGCDKKTAWAFFSDPKNLQKITPQWLDFRILSGADTAMHPGQIIRYRISAIAGIPHMWITEITHVVAEDLFVDEQRFGPYRFWHHQHHFETIKGGIRMTDRLHYALPVPPAGELLHPVIRKKLTAIFDFREKTLAGLFSFPH